MGVRIGTHSQPASPGAQPSQPAGQPRSPCLAQAGAPIVAEIFVFFLFAQWFYWGLKWGALVFSSFFGFA